MDDSPLLLVGFAIGLIWGFTALDALTSYTLHFLIIQIFGVVSLASLIFVILLLIIEARLLIPLAVGVMLGAILHVVLASQGITLSSILSRILHILKTPLSYKMLH